MATEKESYVFSVGGLFFHTDVTKTEDGVFVASIRQPPIVVQVDRFEDITGELVGGLRAVLKYDTRSLLPIPPRPEDALLV